MYSTNLADRLVAAVNGPMTMKYIIEVFFFCSVYVQNDSILTDQWKVADVVRPDAIRIPK